MITKPDIFSTVDWGAKKVDSSNFLRPYRGTGICLHHTAGYSKDGNTELYARNIQLQHMGVNGWSDSGHHFLIGRDGVICEGRTGSLHAVGVEKFIRGAHTGDEWSNAHLWGIENEGNTNDKPLTPDQMASLIHLLAWICFCQKIDSFSITGHRDWKATACPGAWLYEQLPSIRLQTHNYLVKNK